MPLISSLSADSARGYGLFGKVSVFVPNPTIWLDASDASTFTFSSGSAVSKWKDKSSNAYEFVQATSANQPSRSGTLNGLSTVVFDGSNDFLRSNLGANDFAFMSGTTPFTTFMVFKDSASSVQLIFDQTTNTSGGTSGSYLATVTATLYHGNQTTTNGQYVENANTIVGNTFAIVQGSWDLANATTADKIKVLVNNANPSNSTSAGSYTSPTNPTNPLTFGAGASSAPNYYMNGAIAEFRVYSGTLSTDQKTTVYNELKAKWGL